MLVFRKIWRALFSSISRFEIRAFGLLATKSNNERAIQMLLGTEIRFLIYCTLSIHLCHF